MRQLARSTRAFKRLEPVERVTPVNPALNLGGEWQGTDVLLLILILTALLLPSKLCIPGVALVQNYLLLGSVCRVQREVVVLPGKLVHFHINLLHEMLRPVVYRHVIEIPIVLLLAP